VGQIGEGWLAHHHEARTIEMLDEALRGDPGHQLVGAMRALAAIEAQRESQGLFEVSAVTGVRRGSFGILGA